MGFVRPSSVTVPLSVAPAEIWIVLVRTGIHDGRLIRDPGVSKRNTAPLTLLPPAAIATTSSVKLPLMLDTLFTEPEISVWREPNEIVFIDVSLK